MGKPSSKTAAYSCSSAGRKVSKERMTGQFGDCSRAMVVVGCCSWSEGQSTYDSSDCGRAWRRRRRMAERGKA